MLLTWYSKHVRKVRSPRDARIVFDGFCELYVVTWKAMTAGNAQQEGMNRMPFAWQKGTQSTERKDARMVVDGFRERTR